MGTKKSSWSALERRARSTIRTPFVHLFIIFIFILDQESSRRVTHDSHKLQTKAINNSTHHYMNPENLNLNELVN